MTLHRRLTSAPAEIAAVRRAVETFAAAAGFGDRAVADLGLCVNEALANVIRHAYDNQPGRPIELDAAIDGDALTVTLRDWGNGRTPDLSKPRDLSDVRPGGLGLPCLQKLLDGLAFEPQPDGMCLRMTKLKKV